MPVSRVHVVSHPDRARALDLAAEMRAWLVDRGHQIAAAVAGADLVISVGGDGTMLRAVGDAAPLGVPVIGINCGQLGYLTVVDVDEWQPALKTWAAGEAVIEDRMLLSVRMAGARLTGGRTAGERTLGEYLALNEVVVEKTPDGHMVRIGVSIDGQYFTSYAADGMIVATPTGSTAYALSARGPIVDPGHQALLLTPVAPHMLFDRTLVLNPTSTIVLTVGGDRPGTVSVDGANLGELDPGDEIVCTASAVPARLVTSGAHDFHNVLKAKFGLEDR